MVCMHLTSLAMLVVAQIILPFIRSQGLSYKSSVTCLQSQSFANTFKKVYGIHTDLVVQYKKNVWQMFVDRDCGLASPFLPNIECYKEPQERCP